jgi:hypothetical protein
MNSLKILDADMYGGVSTECKLARFYGAISGVPSALQTACAICGANVLIDPSSLP